MLRKTIENGDVCSVFVRQHCFLIFGVNIIYELKIKARRGECIKAAALEPGAVVCDPFMGSGTTARAAAQLGFSFIGFELDEAMCKIANSTDEEGQPVFSFS